MKRVKRSPIDAYTLSLRGLLPPIEPRRRRPKGTAVTEGQQAGAAEGDTASDTRPLRLGRVSRAGRTRRT